jgi:hypothetical protein
MIQGIPMTETITALTASAITTLAFQEFIKSGAGELAKKFTGEALAKMEQLRELIWNRLTGKHLAADVALEQAKAGEQAGVNTITALLGAEMLDEDFAGQVRAIIQEIKKGALDFPSGTHIIQNVTGDQNQIIGQMKVWRVLSKRRFLSSLPLRMRTCFSYC